MIPNNNLSVLPWYTSIEQQNARKWWVYDRIYPLFTPQRYILPFQIMREAGNVSSITYFRIFKRDGTLLGDYTNAVSPNIFFKNYGDVDVIVFPGLSPIAQSFPIGQYYAEMKEGENVWYSEVFTVVGTMAGYLKIEWWNVEDFHMDAGIIVYRNPDFHNVVYLMADIAKPEYTFEEDGESRDGYFFPVKQISEKKYRFSFLASEYLLDVMRLIRLSDVVSISKVGSHYKADSFLMNVEWEREGDVAAVEVEFETATVAKKINGAYLMSRMGDFNSDFNNDFFNIDTL